MYQIYTPEERKRFEELYEVVDAWDLTRYTEQEFERMDSRIRQELARQADLWQIHHDGFELGMSVAKALRAVSGKSGEEMAARHGLAVGMFQRLRQAMAPTPDEERPSSSA
jgi:oligoribonuclease NrnB/cAMP/cGMP phosphodiesterase (DHH superfamily)